MENINNQFVRYLNRLHNYKAQNQNSYGEKNIESPYYKDTLVKTDVIEHIIKDLTELEEPYILILTGHAGDGKTSIMYQVLSELNVKIDTKMTDWEVTLQNNKTWYCIKDFSELSDDKKIEIMRKVVAYPKQGKYVFMVANTGPLINTFGKLFDESKTEYAKMKLIEAMSDNKGEITFIEGYPILVINVAGIDNTDFPGKFIEKIINEKLWSCCAGCKKQGFCHIYLNRKLINDNNSRVQDFISKYYIWISEYGHRLTIRSMTEQIAFMLTGGCDCKDINGKIAKYSKMFPDLFFGYDGKNLAPDLKASSLVAIKIAQENHLESKRIRADEDLLIKCLYDKIFSKDVTSIIREKENQYRGREGWSEELRRFYFFMNLASNNDWGRNVEDIFSMEFAKYIDIRDGKTKNCKKFKELVIDALRMIYLGTVVSENKSVVPITLSKESGIRQSVQLVIGAISSQEIEIQPEKESAMNSKKYNVVLRVGEKVDIVLSLPMLDYFEELRNGVIATNIDPVLSHGIENLKAQLSKVVYSDEDKLEMIVMTNQGYKNLCVDIEDEKLVFSS